MSNSAPLSSKTTTSNFYNQYNYNLQRLFKLVEDAWIDYIINYNQIFMKMTETSYDNICKYICDVLKPIMLKTANDLTNQMEQQQREIQQQREKNNIYS
jgi:hypothetical protein